MDDKTRLVMKYSDEILELVDNQGEYTRSDLQGRAEAIILSVIHESGKLREK